MLRNINRQLLTSQLLTPTHFIAQIDVYGHKFYLSFDKLPADKVLSDWFDDIMGILGIGLQK